MVSFGAHRAGGDFILALARGTDTLLIGAIYGSDSVGLYSRASALLIQPLQQFLLPVNAVFLPALSRLQSQPAVIGPRFCACMKQSPWRGSLLQALFLALARPITLVLLGPKRIDAAATREVLRLQPYASPFRMRLPGCLRVKVAAATAMCHASDQRRSHGSLLLAGLPFGPVGVAIAFSISFLCVRIPLYVLSRRP